MNLRICCCSNCREQPDLGLLLPLVLIVGIFYFLLFMPMQRQKKKQQKMLKPLENGNMVLTTGGIVGTIVSVNEDDTLMLAGEARQRQAAGGAQRGVQSGHG